MKGGQVPILIQRWCPSDYQDDEEVRVLLMEQDWPALTFYRQFLDHAWISGGDLPADRRRLAAKLLMPLNVVEAALERLLGVLIFEEDGRLYQARQRREVAKELEFRAKQAVHGEASGKARREKATLKAIRGRSEGSLKVASSEPEATANPPAPSPAPAPAPAPLPTEEEATPLLARSPAAGASGPPAQVEPPVLVYPVTATKAGGSTEWGLAAEKLAEWRECFPGLDVPAECRKALQWCRDNPTRRKTAAGMLRFLSTWLSKAQDRGGSPSLNGAARPPSTTSKPPWRGDDKSLSDPARAAADSRAW